MSGDGAGPLQRRMREMFTLMVEAKDLARLDEFYDPDFELVTNGGTQSMAEFRAGHERVYPTSISYAVRYDEESWVEQGDRLAGRAWITIGHPGRPAQPIEVVFVAGFRGNRIHRLVEVTWPDWSALPSFSEY